MTSCISSISISSTSTMTSAQDSYASFRLSRSSLMRSKGSPHCSSGLAVSDFKRSYTVSGRTLRYTTVPSCFRSSLLQGAAGVPPPTEKIPLRFLSANSCSSAVSCCRKYASPRLAKISLMVQPSRRSISLSVSSTGTRSL